MSDIIRTSLTSSYPAASPPRQDQCNGSNEDDDPGNHCTYPGEGCPVILRPVAVFTGTVAGCIATGSEVVGLLVGILVIMLPGTGVDEDFSPDVPVAAGVG